MKTGSFLLAFLALAFVSCSSSTGESAAEKERTSYEETRKALLEKEQKNPEMFLSVSGDFRKNLIGQTVVKGKISSSATIARYKDIQIKLDFYSATKTLLESDHETIFVEMNPRRTETFKTKYFAPKGTDSVALSIKGARVVDL